MRCLLSNVRLVSEALGPLAFSAPLWVPEPSRPIGGWLICNEATDAIHASTALSEPLSTDALCDCLSQMLIGRQAENKHMDGR